MFTGLIEAMGEIAARTAMPGGFRLRLRTDLAPSLADGESLSVNGVCLTVTSTTAEEVTVDVGPETARVTTLGRLNERTRVNLERSMRADARFGGHFVQGHVDGLGTVEEVRREGDAHWITIGYDPGAAGCLVPKGSIAVDGISLTVATLEPSRFSVMIIPFTWAHTTLADARPGTVTNLEYDIIGKYVARAAAVAASQQASATPRS